VLLICAGLMLRSLYNLLSVDPGFRTANVLSMQVSLNWTKYSTQEDQHRFFDEVLRRVESLPGVNAASVSWMAPLSDMSPMSGGVTIEGLQLHAGEPVPQVDYEIASPDYFRVLGVPLLSGRSFTDRDTSKTLDAAIVNARMAKHYWPDADPLGHRVSTDNGKTWQTVVGVVGDVHQYGLEKQSNDSIYLPLDQVSITNSHLMVRTTSDPMRLANRIQQIVHSVDPQEPVTEIRTLEELRDRQLGTPRETAVLLTLFAGVALFITIVGVTGTLALSVARRSKEIGIRIALGAGKEQILRSVLTQGMVPVLAGLLLGALAAALATRVLANMLFAVRPDDPATFAGIALLLLAVALAGCLLPARRALNIDLMKALRTD
jgi:predicted permease